MTNFEYLKRCTPTQLAWYIRTRLAGNLGCPPVNLMHALDPAHCTLTGSCEKCWIDWLKQERPQDWTDELKVTAEVVLCKNCAYGAAGDNGHPFIGCMLPRFYGAIMAPDDFCKHGVPKPVPAEEAKRRAKEWRDRKWAHDRLMEAEQDG